MSRLRRVAFSSSLESLMMGNLWMRKTFEPRLATRLAKYSFIPLISATTRIRVETERMTPSSIRNERSLWARMVCSAMSAGSRKKCPRDSRRCSEEEAITLCRRDLSFIVRTGAKFFEYLYGPGRWKVAGITC